MLAEAKSSNGMKKEKKVTKTSKPAGRVWGGHGGKEELLFPRRVLGGFSGLGALAAL